MDAEERRDAARRRSRARATGLAARLQAQLNRDLAEGDAQAESDILYEQRQKISQFIKKDAARLKVSDVWANPAAAPGGELYAKFAAAYNRARDQSIRLVFHGTAEANIDAICKHGLDPNRRGQHGQAHGRGEYFAEDSNISVAYCQGGKKMIVFAVLMDPSGLTKRTTGSS